MRQGTDGETTDAFPRSWFSWLLAGVGVAGAMIAFVADDTAARDAASQDWSPFVLVAGLLLIGLVADNDGLFLAAGNRLARVSSSGPVLFLGAAILIGVVTAVLNLDTSVAFLTPVLVYSARSRHGGEAPLLYGCLLLSNAGSLFLPGSNLTNLIVLGRLRLTGAAFFVHMWLPALAALGVTAGVIMVLERHELRATGRVVTPAPRPKIGLGLVGVAAASLLVLVLSAPALPVLAVGLVVSGVELVRHQVVVSRALDVIGAPLLAGLFGGAVALGTLGRAWSGPSVMLGHLNTMGTAAVAALSTVLVNNLPAASILAAHAPVRPYALLVGLNLGPNLCVTGSLAWLLWMRSARMAGARPSLARASRVGAWAVPLSIAAALGVLTLVG